MVYSSRRVSCRSKDRRENSGSHAVELHVCTVPHTQKLTIYGAPKILRYTHVVLV